jgi:hypothetical protein
MTTALNVPLDALTIDAATKSATAGALTDGSMTTRCISETMRVYSLAAMIAQVGVAQQRVVEFIEAVQAATWTLGLLLPTNVDEAGRDYAPGKSWLAQTATVVPRGDMGPGWTTCTR